MGSFVFRAGEKFQKEMERLRNSIEQSFGIKLKKCQVLDVMSWKVKSSKVVLTEKRLLEILHGR